MATTQTHVERERCIFITTKNKQSDHKTISGTNSRWVSSHQMGNENYTDKISVNSVTATDREWEEFTVVQSMNVRTFAKDHLFTTAK